jgi:hypothetical protein
MRPGKRLWSDAPWLAYRADELARTTGFSSLAIYRAAKALFDSGVPDEVAANILVAADSEAGQVIGIEAFVDAVLTVIDRTWDPERRAAKIVKTLEDGS